MPENQIKLSQLQIQVLFKGTNQLITLESAKTDNEDKISGLRDEIVDAWAGRQKFGFQGTDGVAIHINFAEVLMLTTQIVSDKYVRKEA